MKKIAFTFVLAVFGTSLAIAQISNVEQEVFGMDCAPCAYGLERGLKKMEGLEKVKVSLNDGKAYLNLSSDNRLSLKKIQEEVKRNGFSARSAEVTLKGALVNDNGKWKIKVNNEVYHIGSDTDAEILGRLKSGEIKIKGWVKDVNDTDLDGHWDLTITKNLNF